MILGPMLGALADRYGAWKILFIASIMALALWPIPALISAVVPFAILWSLLNGIVSSTFALSFTVLSASTSSRVRGRVMTFAYMPMNIGFMVGGAVGARITQSSVFNIFPAAALFNALGLIGLIVAYRQKVSD
jgi:MFS family permease